MTTRELENDQLLGALGELHRKQRAELLGLEQAAEELAAQEPERVQALEDRLVNELFATKRDAPQAARVKPQRLAKLASLAAVSLAMAAAVLLWVRQPASQPFEVSYTLVAPAPDARERSAAAPAREAVYSLGRALRFALRPSERYEGALRIDCYAVQGDMAIRLAPQVELDAAGGARVTLQGSELHEGSWRLQFYAAPPTAASVSASQALAGECPSGTRCLTFAARFVQR